MYSVEVIGMEEGEDAAYIFEFTDFYDPENDISAMARTTAFPCSIVTQMIARDEFDEAGVIHPVKIGYDRNLSKRFFNELSDRKIKIDEYHRRPIQKQLSTV